MSDPTPQKPSPTDPPTEKELCPVCLNPNPPGTHFCVDCGAPLSSYAATAPLEHCFAEGHLYRRAVNQPSRPITLIGMWILFGGMALFGLGLLLPTLQHGQLGVSSLFGLFLLLLSCIALWRITRNYLRQRRAVPHAG